MSFSKELWGNNVWYLFHTIAHKIKEDKFEFHKNTLIFILKNICNTLPCPECSSDAKNMLNNVNFDSIKNKNDFKLLLFNFHNAVSKKLNKPQFNLEELDKKYATANIDALYNNFYIIYSSRTNIPQLMNSSFHRQQLFPKIKEALIHIRNDLI